MSLLKFPVVSINKIHRRCCRDCRRDRNFSISATLVAAVVLVAAIAEECVSIYRHRRRNTFFDDSGDSSDGSDYMETGLNRHEEKSTVSDYLNVRFIDLQLFYVLQNRALRQNQFDL